MSKKKDDSGGNSQTLLQISSSPPTPKEQAVTGARKSTSSTEYALKIRSEEESRSERSWKPQGEGLVNFSDTLPLKRMAGETSPNMKDYSVVFGDSTDEDDLDNSCMSTPHAHPTAEDRAVLAMSVGGESNATSIDTSIEENAARIWPQCQRPCLNCHTPHVAIPGSSLSETCLRISIVVHDMPAPAADKSKQQSFLVPADTYELCLIGWLIWSTYVHQTALRDATAGRHPKSQRPESYIRTEIGRINKTKVVVKHTKHQSKSSFQSWWEGKKNLTSRREKQWMVITFPWDMGDIDIVTATFGAMGPLFSFPTVESPQGSTAEAARLKVQNYSQRKLKGRVKFADETASDLMRSGSGRNRAISGGGGKVQEHATGINKGKADAP